MKILAIDSSGMPASVAVCEDGTLAAEYTVNNRKTHSQTLVPMMDEVRNLLGLDLESVDAIAVAGGPGSFTGLRIGSAAAKGIGLALDRPLIHVPTLEAMAYNYYGSECLVVPMLDARNHQVFAGIYTFRQTESGAEQDDPLCVLSDQEPVGIGELCERLDGLSRDTGKPVILLGDGAQAYRTMIEEKLKAPHQYAPAHLAQQRAGSVAVRGMELARQGRTETAAMHRPDYLRVSQAERVRAEKRASEDALRILPLTAEDLPLVTDAERQYYSLPWSERVFRDALNREYYLFLKAEMAGTFAGYCGFQQSFGIAEITNVTVFEAYRRRGIARRMLQVLMEKGRARGVERFTLEVRRSNEPAVSLYKSLGFYEEGVRKDYYEAPKEDALILWTK